MEAECLFCRVVAGEVPGDVVYQNDQAMAFRDVNPQAPTHILVVPKEHYADLAELAGSAPDVLTDVARAAAEVATLESLDGNYRVVFNTGAGAGQSVFHCHAHVLGGRALGWPPG
jgi:histidine triad (HIT) family protein